LFLETFGVEGLLHAYGLPTARNLAAVAQSSTTVK
jgi:hypothetical protein